VARDIGDLKKVVRALTDKGAGLQAAEQPIDTTTSHGRMFLDLLSVFAEFETNIRKERQAEGIAKAKGNRETTLETSRSSRKPQEGSPSFRFSRILHARRDLHVACA
jgi:DNA invertase Pin-like site-specific DNA recombinase